METAFFSLVEVAERPGGKSPLFKSIALREREAQRVRQRQTERGVGHREEQNDNQNVYKWEKIPKMQRNHVTVLYSLTPEFRMKCVEFRVYRSDLEYMRNNTQEGMLLQENNPPWDGVIWANAKKVYCYCPKDYFPIATCPAVLFFFL